MLAIIQLFDNDGQKLLDSVSTEYEDSFSLETFGDLAVLHAVSPPAGTKSFIIARVQTWDPKQPEKVFLVHQANLFLLQCFPPQQDIVSNPKLSRKALYSPFTRIKPTHKF